jgi:hypothetical protein
MPDESERVQLVKAIFAGLKDLCIVIASVATIWIQAGNAGNATKLEAVAAKQEEVAEKTDKIALTAHSADKTIRDWKASYEKPRTGAAETVPPDS